MRRMHIIVPDELHSAVKELAQAKGVTAVDVIRQFLKLGLLATQPGMKVYIEDEAGKESRVMIL
jgi:hypothetical protein